MNTPHDIADRIIGLFHERGDEMYAGEHISQTEHAVQCALAAETAGVAETLVVASLLHDVGHLLHDLGEDAAADGIDAGHEALGADWLANWFGPQITAPIRLHVPAKRYLCTVDPEYSAQLSDASITSLQVQGGPMTAEECRAFELVEGHGDAVMLRRFDDVGKVMGMPTPSIDSFRDRIAAQVAA